MNTCSIYEEAKDGDFLCCGEDLGGDGEMRLKVSRGETVGEGAPSLPIGEGMGMGAEAPGSDEEDRGTDLKMVVGRRAALVAEDVGEGDAAADEAPDTEGEDEEEEEADADAEDACGWWYDARVVLSEGEKEGRGGRRARGEGESGEVGVRYCALEGERDRGVDRVNVEVGVEQEAEEEEEDDKEVSAEADGEAEGEGDGMLAEADGGAVDIKFLE